MMGEVIQDIRYAMRIHRRYPGFAVVTASMLALGIAVNTMLFSSVDALLLRPLPVSHPEGLVRLVRLRPGLAPQSDFWYQFYVAVRDRRDLFSGVLAQFAMNLAVSDGGTAERARAHFVSGNFFSILGVQALYGRTLTP